MVWYVFTSAYINRGFGIIETDLFINWPCAFSALHRYRRIAGDTCEYNRNNQIDSPAILPCPDESMDFKVLWLNDIYFLIGSQTLKPRHITS